MIEVGISEKKSSNHQTVLGQLDSLLEKIRLESQFILCIIMNSIWIKGKGVKVLEKLLLTKAAEYQLLFFPFFQWQSKRKTSIRQHMEDAEYIFLTPTASPIECSR